MPWHPQGEKSACWHMRPAGAAKELGLSPDKTDRADRRCSLEFGFTAETKRDRSFGLSSPSTRSGDPRRFP